VNSASRVRLVPALAADNLFLLSIDGPASGNYNIEATETLHPPNWRVIGTLNLEVGVPAEFTEKFDLKAPARYYRVSKP
jgi:hypothetical protein